MYEYSLISLFSVKSYHCHNYGNNTKCLVATSCNRTRAEIVYQPKETRRQVEISQILCVVHPHRKACDNHCGHREKADPRLICKYSASDKDQRKDNGNKPCLFPLLVLERINEESQPSENIQNHSGLNTQN